MVRGYIRVGERERVWLRWNLHSGVRQGRDGFIRIQAKNIRQSIGSWLISGWQPRYCSWSLRLKGLAESFPYGWPLVFSGQCSEASTLDPNSVLSLVYSSSQYPEASALDPNSVLVGLKPSQSPPLMVRAPRRRHVFLRFLLHYVHTR